MFPEPKPSNLVTVPACLECNRSFQKNEEFFRGILRSTGAPIETDAPELWAKIGRGLGRSPGLRKTIADSLRGGPMVNPEGVEVGRWMAIEDNWERIVSLIAKCVRGFYWFEMSAPLPPSTSVECPQHGDSGVNLSTLYMITRPGRRSWPGVFDYRYAVAYDDPEASAWVFTFYRTSVYSAYSGIARDWTAQNRVAGD